MKALGLDCKQAFAGVLACPRCPPVDGAGCANDADCQKYDHNYRCDLRRAHGYCTQACANAGECSGSGPERCLVTPPPSFDPQGSGKYCVLGCSTDADCRTAEGYACIHSASDSWCDVKK